MPNCEDLGLCSRHRRPINGCAFCAPVFLKWLGELCWREYCEKKRANRTNGAVG